MTMLFPNQDNWRAQMQDVAAAINENMGELVDVTPVDVAASKPNFPTVMLHGQTVQAIAVFTFVAKQVFDSSAKGKRAGAFEVAPLISTSEPVFSFSYGAVPFALHQGTQIALCRTGELFEVTDAQPDGVSRIVCKVVQLGRQSYDR